MVAVFAGFISNHDATIQSIGFALAFGILVDAFIVRMIIVPIVMSFLGHSAWWLPKWLEKRLPNISIEG
jgi:RND superfamily putative drug exporter